MKEHPVTHDVQKNGGAAFPYVCTDEWKERSEGMTLRDYFASAALTGLLPKLPLVDTEGVFGMKVGNKVQHNLDIAESCYAIADAMLAARKAGTP